MEEQCRLLVPFLFGEANPNPNLKPTWLAIIAGRARPDEPEVVGGTPPCWDYNPPRSPTRVTPQKSRATAGDKTRFLVFAHFQNHPKPPKTVTSVTPRNA